MQETATLLSIIQKRGERGLPLENVYRMLFNRNLYLSAYGNLYRNQGAMTKGATDETVDGMSPDKIDRIIALVRYERYRWGPVRRVHIPKQNGKKRPLGIISCSAATFVFSKSNIQTPMQLVLNCPMSSHCPQRFSCVCR
ncbi:MAG: hypothetical protein MSG64_15005 [Pyrinomonadaceae bacterium MAG19_C2-C3]|nr:hypothetical protein [Pyrinomonadaceae bacterium MAG19_C2-C3]